MDAREQPKNQPTVSVATSGIPGLKGGTKPFKRQDSVPNKPLSGRTLRRGSDQPENGTRSGKLGNGLPSKIPNGNGSRPDWHLNATAVNRPKPFAHNPANTSAVSARGPSSSVAGAGAAPNSAREQHSTKPVAATHRKPPEFGKGRLERGKQISHLGLFPDTDAKRMQRQSTSMNAEAGDHPANLEDVLSPNPHDKKHAVQWRQQIVALKTVRPLKGDELTISVTFAITPLIFDFRLFSSSGTGPNTNSNASSSAAASNRIAGVRKKAGQPSEDVGDQGDAAAQQAHVKRENTEESSTQDPELPSRETDC
ncbi:hypothetical protein BV898_07266 [Hypsibius exemplaris]|uniref:Uncharacterized protein n=1 Tax=Hypsibius exemplaris TaxID=2072580 RepID=A0A1W0WU12_HYPEX|nr:hypothetical protein BV898_07266 [Hypsibius exemplaris]